MTRSSLPRHPRTGLQALGFRANGAPIWPILGGNGDPSNPAPVGDPAGVPPVVPPVPAPPAVPPVVPPVDDPASGQTHFDAAYVQTLRRESAGYRTRATEQETARAAAEQQAEQLRTAQAAAQAEVERYKGLFDGFAKVLNPDAPSGETPPDPAELAKKLAEQESTYTKTVAEQAAEIRRLTVAAALPAVYGEVGVKPGLTQAVLTADGTLSALDPTSKTFVADLKSAVEKALEANPELRVAPVATRSGTEPTGRTGGGDQLTRADLARMSPAEIHKATKDGRLKNVLSGGG